MNTDINDLIKFLHDSPCSFFAIKNIKDILDSNGFDELKESKKFNLEPNKGYYLIRNNSSIIAFKTGTKTDGLAFNIMASHSDSPSFKVKEKPNLNSLGYNKINVEGYGGMLCSTWFDRPLSLVGKVLYKEDLSIVEKLVNIENICSLPSVPIHFNRQANDGMKYDLAIDMLPTISQSNFDLVEYLAKYNNTNKENIYSFDLFITNNEYGYTWGTNNEFFSSPRIDNLECAYATLLGFIDSDDNDTIKVYCCFDNEEIGSTSMQGANSNFLDSTLRRIALSFNNSEEEYYQALAKSFIVSVDNAHAIHPNHQEYYDVNNPTFMNGGIVIKSSASLSYSTNAISEAIFKEVCNIANVPTQTFFNKSNLRGGSTLGSISISHVSINSIDIGLAQLAMHSANETAGVKDFEYLIDASRCFFELTIIKDNNSFIVKKIHKIKKRNNPVVN